MSSERRGVEQPRSRWSSCGFVLLGCAIALLILGGVCAALISSSGH